MKGLIDKLLKNRTLSRSDMRALLENADADAIAYAAEVARGVSARTFQNHIYVRGLIEFTNFCKNDCYYCGIRRSNENASRYRLSKEDILSCCEIGYALGFRTFVLQGGEDGFYTDDKIVEIVSAMKARFPDCAVSLSIGEKSRASYQRFFDAGADRYLLRHETANEEHYKKLHPENLSLANRKKCLYDLKDIGYQVGCGFMVGSPYQTVDTLIDDLYFIKELSPHMIGIGPFIPHHDTPFADEKGGSVEMTLLLLSILRLMHPKVLLPATTALGTLDKLGREKGILAGANVLMPNLSPKGVRQKYELYDNKICTGEEAAECRDCLEARMRKIGYEIVVDRGDYPQD